MRNSPFENETNNHNKPRNERTMARFVPICQSSGLPLTILLFSENGKYARTLAQLMEERAGSNPPIGVNICENMSQILRVPNIPEADFVAFFINHKRLNALDELEESIAYLDKTFLLDRICLICDNAQGSGSMKPHINEIKVKYQLHVLWVDLAAEINLLAKRLLNLVSAVCGANSGLPLITQRAWHRRPNETVNPSPPHVEDMTF